MVELSIKRPVFITCLFVLIMIAGVISLKSLSVDLFPDVTFPIVMVQTPYSGAGPSEIETLVTKPIEDELASVSGIKTLSSISQEGVSMVIVEFSLSMDIKYAEQQVRDRVAKVKNKLPEDADEPIIRRVDPADQPIMMVALESDLPAAQLFDLADQVVKPRFEQVDQVGLVTILGGRKREIRVEMDLRKISDHEISASSIRNSLGTTGKNTPAGKLDKGDSTNVIRTLGEFKSIQEIRQIPVNYQNVLHPVKISDIAEVTDSLADENSRTYVSGKAGLILQIFRQSGANTIAVADNIEKKIGQINDELKGQGKLHLVQDGAKPIRANVFDVKETILIGIILTIVVVFFFLSSLRSTFITSLALPNSLLGAFILMAVAGFSINIMTLLALSLAVGLLVDDAIVVRENIFRHIEMGKSPKQASLDGTKEVLLAVIATTMTVIAVFGPVGFLGGVVGQFFKEFGLTICFAMLISLADAITMAPMMSAYFAGKGHENIATKEVSKNKFLAVVDITLKKFDRFQTWLEDVYVRILEKTMKKPKTVLFMAVGIFVASIVLAKFIPKTFLPPQDNGEFMVALDLPPGTSLDKMDRVAKEVDDLVRKEKEVLQTVLAVGSSNGESNKASIFVEMVPAKKRKLNTSEFKAMVREKLKPYAYANPVVKDQDKVGGGARPFTLNIVGSDQAQLEKEAKFILEKLKHHPALLDVDTTFRPGKPEIQVDIDPNKAAAVGVLNTQVGNEIRALVEGVTPAVFREGGREYDVRIRLKEDQRDIKQYIENVRIPAMNGRLTYLKLFADVKEAQGPTTINRQDRIRYIQINADIAPNGPGMGAAIADVKQLLDKDHPLPAGMRYKFVGQAENFQELLVNIIIAMGLGVVFIYMVLASLYESFVTPFTIMLVLPLAACGAFYALLVTQSSLDLFSMIGCVMLLGIATKNSIILVDYIKQSMQAGMNLHDAILKAGKNRLRPILMTSFALIAGMLPVAIGLNEASKQRTSMGVAIIGGLISSTLLTLVVIPAAYGYIEKVRLWGNRVFGKLVTKDEDHQVHGAVPVVVAKTVEHNTSENKTEVAPGLEPQT
ncbi:efflux RND transporter permease subunit [Bdellovibrio sp. HCB337]|uniref:efflux RND transporter permease subunit n=1 Tax=Bdellovibrio sp. HCB337 TaxID=3394358 RepID=UPI0039A50461